jgi:hypothetical protein
MWVCVCVDFDEVKYRPNTHQELYKKKKETKVFS